MVTTTNATTMTLVVRGANVPDHTFVDDVTVIAVPAGCAPIANNLVHNCGFEASSASPWIHSGTAYDSQISSDNAYGGTKSLFLASTRLDDVWFQMLTVRPRTQYTLSYWVEYWSSTSVPNNDLHVIVMNVPAASGGSLKIVTTNVSNRFWMHVTKTFTTGSGSSARLTVSGKNVPDAIYVDDFSVTAVPHLKVAASGSNLITTLTGLGGQKVYLEPYANRHWVVSRILIAPQTGWSKTWSVPVGGGLFRVRLPGTRRP